MTDQATASDGLPALIIKPHTRYKLHAIGRYIQQFTTALKDTFSERNYIDLLSGPGKCLVRGTNEEIFGSPLLALTTRYPFSHYYFGDIDRNHLVALRKRSEWLATSSTKQFFEGDCNQTVVRILQHIDAQKSANLAVIDGFGVECHWATIKALASCRRMDLIILFPQGMAINRNLKQWAALEESPLDLFFGTSRWREIYEKECGQIRRCVRPFLDLYRQQLRTLGYRKEDSVYEYDDPLIRSRGGHGQKLYYLIFASRHPLGQRFWRQAIEKDAAGQRRLFE